jgi:hypothetical protein
VTRLETNIPAQGRIREPWIGINGIVNRKKEQMEAILHQLNWLCQLIEDGESKETVKYHDIIEISSIISP